MNLLSLKDYNKVYIQPHNNPDADAIASSYALYELLKELGIESEIICYGNTLNNKPNIDKMLRNIKDRIHYYTAPIQSTNVALVLVDCQLGNTNVKPLIKENIYCIDHHEETGANYIDSEIYSNIGACSTIVYDLYKAYSKIPSSLAATLLNFGIHQDTGGLSEKYTNKDIDAKQELDAYQNKAVYSELVHSSFTIGDMTTFAKALTNLQRYREISFCEVNTFDDNLLGNISDILSEISDIHFVITYAIRDTGIKFSIRSHSNKITAVDIIMHITKGFSIQGGGHNNKAGGFMLKDEYNTKHPDMTFNAWLIFTVSNFINYYNNLTVYESGNKEHASKLSPIRNICKINNPVRFIDIDKLFDIKNQPIKVNTLIGSVLITKPGYKVMLGLRGEIYPIRNVTFQSLYSMDGDATKDCPGDAYLKEKFNADRYGIKISNKTFTLNDVLNLPKAYPKHSIRQSYELQEPCYVNKNGSYLKGDRGDFLIIYNGCITHIDKRDVYFDTFYEVDN